MPTTLTFRRGTTSQNDSFTGAAGELSIDTEKKTLRVHDNSTAGGSEVVAVAATQTLTNKTVSLTSNTLSGTTAEFNTALSDGSFATLAGTETLTNKTIDANGTGNSITNIEVADFAAGVVDTDLSSVSASDDTLASAKAIKAYVDNGLSSLSSTTLTEGNTSMVVADSGAGTITATVDGATVATFQAGDLAIPNNVGVLFGNGGEKIESDGTDLTITSTGALQMSVTGTTTVSGALVVSGNFTVNGTTTTLNSTNKVISDALIELANGTTGAPANDAGIVIERGDSDNAFFGWDESADKFIVGTGTFTGASTGDLTITTGTLVANVEGNVTGNLTGNVTGNLTGTATAAQYSDVAERFASDTTYEPGTVVALGGAAEITAVAEEASDEVFGVISGEHQAAFKMNGGAGSDATHPYVAMTGRVDVKVIGSVNKGDRLISASVPGYARAATKAECTAFNVIGRALESKHTEEAGMVLAVVRVSH